MSAIIPNVTKLSSLVTRVLGCNPGPMTLQGTNTYIIGNGKRRLLVDAGQPGFPEYIENLQKTVDQEGCELSDVIITHWHPDHVGGVPDVLRSLKSVPRLHKYPRMDGPETNIGKISLDAVKDGQIFNVDGGTVQVVYTPGHTSDHIALYLKEEESLFSADCILGEGTAVFEDLHSYMQSLQRILDLNPKQIYPGHGPVIEDPLPKIEYYIKHRLEREHQILTTLTQEGGEKTAMDLVKLIYKEVPEHLHKAAEVNVGHHLEKLAKDGKVERADSSRWRAS